MLRLSNRTNVMVLVYENKIVPLVFLGNKEYLRLPSFQ